MNKYILLALIAAVAIATPAQSRQALNVEIRHQIVRGGDVVAPDTKLRSGDVVTWFAKVSNPNPGPVHNAKLSFPMGRDFRLKLFSFTGTDSVKLDGVPLKQFVGLKKDPSNISTIEILLSLSGNEEKTVSFSSVYSFVK